METLDPNAIPTPEEEGAPEPIVPPQTSDTQVEEELSDRLLSEAKDPDAKMRELNQRAERAEFEASQLRWPPDAVKVETPTQSYALEPIPMQWGPGRNALYRALQSADGGESLPGVDIMRGDLDARIILFLACHDAAEWRSRRTIEIEGVRIPMPPLSNDYPRFLQAIDQWADIYIPLSMTDEAMAAARNLVNVHLSTRHEVINTGGGVGTLGK